MKCVCGCFVCCCFFIKKPGHCPVGKVEPLEIEIRKRKKQIGGLVAEVEKWPDTSQLGICGIFLPRDYQLAYAF